MKRIYSLYVTGLGLVLATGILVVYPPSVLAATCETTCPNGQVVKVTGVSCGCTEQGCTYVDARGRRKTIVCPNLTD